MSAKSIPPPTYGIQLKNKGIEIIYTSPKLRARETAHEVAHVLHVPIEIVDDLRERNNYGVLTGLTKSEAQKKYPIDFEKISQDKTYHDVTNSESYEEIKKRAMKVFEKILSTDYDTIAVISHGGIISTYVREVLTQGKNIKLGDCAILEIIKKGDSCSLSSVTNAQLV